jgi:hypothetical protein
MPLKQVDEHKLKMANFEGFGNRHLQYDLIDSRRKPHQHNFKYSAEYPRPLGKRSEHLPIDD